MRIENIFSKMAWGEREDINRSAKWSAAMVVATFAALLVFCNSLLYGAKQTDIQRAAQARVAQRRAAAAQTLEILQRDWRDWTASDCESVLKYSVWVEHSASRVQLRSALPIREALLRQLQLKKHYDTMNSAEKLAFDKQNPPNLIETENDPVLLYVEHDATYYGRHGDGEDVDPAQEAALQLPDDTLVMPIKTEALQDDQDANRIIYTFPRVVNGKRVLSAGDQELNFVFGRPLVRAGHIRPLQNPQKFEIQKYKLVSIPGTNQKVLESDGLMTRVSFSTAELIYNGKLEY